MIASAKTYYATTTWYASNTTSATEPIDEIDTSKYRRVSEWVEFESVSDRCIVDESQEAESIVPPKPCWPRPRNAVVNQPLLASRRWSGLIRQPMRERATVRRNRKGRNC